MTEQEIREIFKDEFQRFYKRVFPTFTMSGGHPTEKHGTAELCLTTQSSQGCHFYEGGIALCGRNIVLNAKKNIYIDAKDNVRMRSGSQTDILAGADMNLDSNRELFINGGSAVGIHCESNSVDTTSGVDVDLAPDFFDQLSSFYGGYPVDKITRFNDPSGAAPEPLLREDR